MSEQEQRYIDRPIEDEGLSFEAFVKLENLRDDQSKKINVVQQTTNRTYCFKKGDPVRIVVQFNDKFGKHTIELVGYTNDDEKYEPSVIVGDTVYTEYLSIRGRNVIDYSNVVVREEIKKMPTKQLLSQYRFKRSEYVCSSTNPMTGNYMDEMKAELSTRENIETKYEKKLNKSK